MGARPKVFGTICVTFGLLALAGVNVWYGGPLDKRGDYGKRTLDHHSSASNPGELSVSQEKLRRLDPDIHRWLSPRAMLFALRNDRSWWRANVPDQLRYGDSRAAIVAKSSPLLVAAYSDELDAVAMLRFPDNFVPEYRLEVGTRLLTINTYQSGRVARDLDLGDRHLGQYGNFHPFIADFLSDDVELIEQRKATIQEEEWFRCLELARDYFAARGTAARDGRPTRCGKPAWTMLGSFQLFPALVA